MKRRRFVATAASAMLSGGLSNGPRFAEAAQVSELRVVVHASEEIFEYAMKDGRNLGAFKSEIGGFEQSCYRASHDKFPLTVDFRPDLESERIEVVFELGNILSSSPKNLETYRVEIFNGSNQVAAIDVPKHYWFSRWRWQSKPRPVVADVKDLIDRGLLPPLGLSEAASQQSLTSIDSPQQSSSQVKGLPTGGTLTSRGRALGLGSNPLSKKSETAGLPPYAIMGLAGVMARMGTTGERPDIGMVTEHQGEFICTGSATALVVTRDQAEAAGTVPWHLRDAKTGAPVNLDAFPKMSWYYDSRGGSPHILTAKTPIQIDSAHQPALAYVAYLLTGDPYHLEDVQFAANWNRGSLPHAYRLSIPQSRAFAWTIRTLAQCAKVTPAIVPQWLLPREYWLRDLERMRVWFIDTFVNSKDPLHAVFRTVAGLDARRDEGPSAPRGTHFAPWEDEFIASVFGWLVVMGFQDWRPCFVWKIGSTIARTNGTSGWGRSYSTPYRLLVKRSASDPCATSWAEAWAITRSARSFNVINPDAYEDSNPSSLIFTRGALAMAVRLNTPGAQACYAWVDREVKRQGFNIPYKWSVLIA